MLSNRERDRLLVKYLLGETSPEENEIIQQWKGARPAHAQYADEFYTIWVESKRLAPVESIDPKAAWERFRESGKLKGRSARIFGHAETRGPIAGVRTAGVRVAGTRTAFGRARRWSAVAAVILLLAGGAYTWWKLDAPGVALTWQSGAAARVDTLPDGSRVTLNKFSSIKLPGGRSGRMVRLSGEAFFEVVHDARRPFYVEVNGVTIRDLGTGFNVRSANGTTEIIVETGAVLVTVGADGGVEPGAAAGSGEGKASGAVKVSAGEKVFVTAGQATIVKTPVSNRLYQYYRTKRFVCRGTPLSELISVLNEAYGTHIVIPKEETSRLLMTATFDNEDLDSILAVITKTFGLNIQKKGGSIVLKQP